MWSKLLFFCWVACFLVKPEDAQPLHFGFNEGVPSEIQEHGVYQEQGNSQVVSPLIRVKRSPRFGMGRGGGLRRHSWSGGPIPSPHSFGFSSGGSTSSGGSLRTPGTIESINNPFFRAFSYPGSSSGGSVWGSGSVSPSGSVGSSIFDLFG